MSGFSRCHRFVLYSWHITVPSVRRRHASANPDGNAFANGVHCALAIDDQPTRRITASPELEMFFRKRFCMCVPRLASQRLVSQIKIVTVNTPMRLTHVSSQPLNVTCPGTKTITGVWVANLISICKKRHQVARIVAGRSYLNLNRGALPFAFHRRMFSYLARIAMPCLPGNRSSRNCLL